MIRSTTAHAARRALAVLVLGAAACSRGNDTSLRDDLANLPQHGTEGPAAETAAPPPIDLEDTIGFPGAEDPAPAAGAAPDTLRPNPNLRPPLRPLDTQPWVPAHPDTLRVPAAAPGRDWTARGQRQRRPEARPATLTAVRAARNDGFDRVVLEFAGGRLPGYEVEYVDRPIRQCGSGETVRVAGEGWLRLRLEPAQAHDDRGRATVQNRAFSPDLPVIRELRMVCDFEGQVEWVVGVRSPNHFRIMELREPARLVVDVRH